MRKTILLLFGILMMPLCYALAGNITVGTQGGNGGVEVKGTWAAGSTVTVYDHMIIPVGQSLTIEKGVNVIIADTSLKIEMIALGNLYCMGTEDAPVTISVKPELVPATVATTNPFPALWGSIMCDTTCSELVMLYTTARYYGAATTNNSPSVLLHLFKNAAGLTTPFLNFRCHNGGKLVMEHNTFSNGNDDAVYIEGGSVIYAYNTTYQQGSTGGESVDTKAGTVGDFCYNLFYSQNTNAFKLSNTGSRNPQSSIMLYNNTILNSGWRRPTVKGGGVWYEAGVIAKTYNTLFINDRFGIKTDGKEDTASRNDYNYYYGYTTAAAANFNKPTSGLLAHGAHDIYDSVAGHNDPMVENYPLSTDVMNSKYDAAWDFHLKKGSPALGKGTTNIKPFFATNGLTINGVTYKSPMPSDYIGAFGVKKDNGINETTASQNFKVYPNPVTNLMHIENPAAGHGTWEYSLTDLSGKVIAHSQVSASVNTTVIDIANLESGIYIMNITSQNQVQVNKIVKY